MTTTPVRRATTAALLAGTTVLGLAVSAPAAHAGDDDRVERSGSCSGAARWDLKVKTDDGGLEVEGEVDSNAAGQSWRWRIVHDGTVAARGTATTRGRSGSFSVERRTGDGPGTDRVVFVATRGDQTCRGRVTY